MISAEGDRRRSHLRHGWYWGSQSFAEKMLKLTEKVVRSRRNRTYRSGAVSKAHDEREAERLLREGMAAAGLGEETLEALPGSDTRKVALANLLMGRTVARQSWIAERLAMSSAANIEKRSRNCRPS